MTEQQGKKKREMNQKPQEMHNFNPLPWEFNDDEVHLLLIARSFM